MDTSAVTRYPGRSAGRLAPRLLGPRPGVARSPATREGSNACTASLACSSSWSWPAAARLPGTATGKESPPAAAPAGVDSTAEMAALLQQRAAQVDPAKLSFAINDRRAAVFEAALRKPLPPAEAIGLRFEHAVELLNSGQNERALQTLEAVETELKSFSPASWDSQGPTILLVKAMAHLRMGEEQNCAQLHNRDSCLLPIRGQGVHARREGSTRAVERAEGGSCDAHPDNLRGALAAEHRAHDAGRLPGARALARTSSRPARSPRSTRCRASPTWRRRRASTSSGWPAAPSSTTSTATAASTSCSRPSASRPDALLPQPRRRHVRGAHRGGRPHRRGRRPQHGPGRLRQRRLPRRARAARRLDGRRRAASRCRCCATTATGRSPT